MPALVIPLPETMPVVYETESPAGSVSGSILTLCSLPLNVNGSV